MRLFSGTNQEQTKDKKIRRNFYRVWTIIGLLVLVYVLGFIMKTLSVPIAVTIWTAIIVFCLSGVVSFFEKRGLNRILGTAIAYIGMFVVLGALFALLFSPVFGIGDQFQGFIEELPIYVERVVSWGEEVRTTHLAFLQNDVMEKWVDEATASLTVWATDVAKNSANTLVTIGSSIGNFFVIIGFALIISFWILMELPALGRECRRIVAGKFEQDFEMITSTISRVVGGFIKATLIYCTLIGIGCAIAFMIIGLPNAIALGAIVGLFNIIPVIGGWLGAAIPGIVGLFVSPWVALIALIVTVAIQTFIYTFVSPKLMADSVDAHPALVLLAMLLGLAVGGAMNGLVGSLVGMLASVPAAAALKAIFVYYFEKNTGRQIVSEDGVLFKGVPAAVEDSDVNPLEDAASSLRGVKRQAPVAKPRDGKLSGIAKLIGGSAIDKEKAEDLTDKEKKSKD